MKSLKLNQIEKVILSKKEMQQLIGGDSWICSCSCYWEDNGGSATQDNRHANADIPGGGSSIEGDNAHLTRVTTTS